MVPRFYHWRGHGEIYSLLLLGSRAWMVTLLVACGGHSHEPTDAGSGPGTDAALDASAWCDVAEPEPCYPGPDGTEGRGACHAGLLHCREGLWSPCEEVVLPIAEECNGIDDDCDGTTDDGVLNECGDCSADCVSQCAGVGCDLDFVTDPEGGTIATEKGAAVLPADADVGRVRVVFEACDDGSETFWRRLSWDADLAGGSLSFRVRIADTRKALDRQEWIDLPAGEPPLELGPTLQKAGGAQGGYALELEITLTHPPGDADMLLRSVTILYRCGGWFG